MYFPNKLLGSYNANSCFLFRNFGQILSRQGNKHILSMLYKQFERDFYS